MIDTAKITVKSGNGGNGAMLFRREKYIPKGGPWGGDGGKGGDIIFITDNHINTLTTFRRQKHFMAEDGANGGKNRMKGKDGVDLNVKVPRGTLIKDIHGNIIADLTEENEEFLLQKGGEGGLGNWHFKSSVNQTPRFATMGKITEENQLELELKMIADVGITGLPSSGKSTLLNSLTNAHARTAAYHFTTLEPNLGVLEIDVSGNPHEVVFADIPGIIEGASEGRGLGFEFLKHIERTKVILHVVDGSEILYKTPSEIFNNYTVLNNEMNKWSRTLSDKKQIVAINKIDITEVKEKTDVLRNEFEKNGIDPLFISAATGEGFEALVYTVVNELEKHKQESYKFKTQKELEKDDIKITYDINSLRNKRIVFKEKKERLTSNFPGTHGPVPKNKP